MALLDRKYVPWVCQNHLSNLPAELKHDIIQRSPVKTLGRLAQVSRLFYEIVTPVLYEKDAADERPRAIFWAASFNEDEATGVTEKAITKVLDLANDYGGDVNRMDHCDMDPSLEATPLHVAAARGNITAAGKLLDLGANPNALGQGDSTRWPGGLRDRTVVSRLEDPTVRHVASRSHWRPLFSPFILQDEKMVELLLRFGASPVLSVPVDNPRATAYDPGTINILHIISTRPSAKATVDDNRSYFEKFVGLLDVPIQQGSTPLFLALRHHNVKALEMLIANGANIEVLNQFERTLLIQAITYRFTSKDAQARHWYNEVAEYLIKSRKAKISSYGPYEAWETPLTCIIKSIPKATYKEAIQDARAMINLLLKHGADVNERSNEGVTMLHALCDAICSGNSINALSAVFKQLVMDGADLTIPFSDGRSLLGTCIMKYDQRPLCFFKLLLELHASLVPQEVDALYLKWSQSSSLRKALDGFLRQYHSHVSQTAIDAVYASVLGRDEAVFKQLREHFSRTTIAERFAAETLLDRKIHPKWFDHALGMKGFDGSYIHSDRNSLLHCIIVRLESNPNYKDAQARGDANRVLLRGADLGQRNSRGQTPLQALWNIREKRDCPLLRLYLYDVKARWDEITAGHAPESINQANLKRQWREILDSALPIEEE